MGKADSRQAVDPALIKVWLERCRVLDARLKDRPDGEWAWLWRIRCDILHYLLGRYGHADSVGRLADRSPEADATTTSETESVASFLRQAPEALAGRGAAHPPRERVDFRKRLCRLHMINEKVRESQPKLDPYADIDPRARIIRTTYPDDLDGVKCERLCTEQTFAVTSALEGIREYLDRNGHTSHTDTPLTEDEVLMILAEDDAVGGG